MKREILFKAKMRDKNTWVCGTYTKLSWDCGFKEVIVEHVLEKCELGFDDSTYCEIDPNTLCQFTGLLDKNGNKIFDGDLVKMKKGRICKVNYRMTGVFVGFDFMPHSNVTLDNKPIEFDIYNSDNLEIIGNIHD